MNIGDLVLALIAYPSSFILPGLLWTFIFKDKIVGVIDRLVISAGISICTMPLCVFTSYVFLGGSIDFPSILLIVIMIAILPIFIVLLGNLGLEKYGISSFKGMLVNIKQFTRVIFNHGNYKSRHHIILGVIILMAIILTLSPHYDYCLPIHTDEWHYMAYSDYQIHQYDQEPTNLYYSGHTDSWHWEMGFIIFLSFMKITSGVSWPFLFTTLPSVLFALGILMVYLIGKKHNWGLQAAFIVALTPSTLQFLGPAFLVPASMGILMIIFSLYLINNITAKWKYLLLMLVMLFTFIVHPQSGGYLFIVLTAIFMMILFKKEKKDIICLASILLLFVAGVFMLPLNFVHDLNWDTLTQGSYFFLPALGIVDYIDLVGFIIPVMAVIGFVFVIKNKDRIGQNLSAALFSMISFVLILYYIYPHFYSVQAVFDRAIMVIIVLVGIIAGAGLFTIQKNVSRTFSIILICCILALSLNSHVNDPYYHIISQDEYEDFVWIRENLNSSYERAILDPWKAVAFTPVTGKMVFFKIPQGPGSDMETNINQINTFFAGECNDTEFLLSYDIDIVYTHGTCTNPDLIEVRSGIYVLNY